MPAQGNAMDFQPDYRHLVAAARNQRPARLPLYEHNVSTGMMERVLGSRFAHLNGQGPEAQREYFRHCCAFFREMTYDCVSYEVGICSALVDGGAIMGGKAGPIQSRADFDRYPWDDLPRRYWEVAGPRFAALAAEMPAGMKAVGGVGNGVFEISEDLVGYEWLCLMLADDPELVGDLFQRIGSLMDGIWTEFLRRHPDLFCVLRFGDDLGFKSSTLMSPPFIRKHIMPQYKRVIGRILATGTPFLWHSCGKIFPVMEDAIACGICAKHSNEDQIAPFDDWISGYGSRIGLFGGIDVDILCRENPQQVYELVLERGLRFRANASGFALGSGNSIPDYIPTEGYLAMVRAGQEIRRRELAG
jgi:uroporphyrinogen decarboxylase